MARTLYSPRLSDDVVRRLYLEAKSRGKHMTTLADELLRQSLGVAEEPPVQGKANQPPADGETNGKEPEKWHSN